MSNGTNSSYFTDTIKSNAQFALYYDTKYKYAYEYYALLMFVLLDW